MNYDRIILELLERVSRLEEEVRILKSSNAMISSVSQSELTEIPNLTQNITGRDTTKYMLDGVVYGKNRLVLAIVKKYMQLHPNTTAGALMTIFDKSLQGSLGVVRTVNDVRNSYFDSEKRFFLRNEEIIITSTENCAVCSQWGVSNIDNMIMRAKELGMEVEALS